MPQAWVVVIGCQMLSILSRIQPVYSPMANLIPESPNSSSYMLKFVLFPNTNFIILWPFQAQSSVIMFLTYLHLYFTESKDIYKQLDKSTYICKQLDKRKTDEVNSEMWPCMLNLVTMPGSLGLLEYPIPYSIIGTCTQHYTTS